MKLVTQQFLSLDGVYQGPGSPDEDRTDGFERGGWLVPFVDGEFEARVEAWTAEADAFLFGRRTYDAFSAFWPTVIDPADKIAGMLNGKPKYVVTRHPIEVDWSPVTVLSGDLASEVAALKDAPGREVQVHGSGTLAGSLIAAGLVDEVRLVIAPVVVGHGRKLFPGTIGPKRFELIEQVRTPGGLTLLRFAAATGEAAGSYIRSERV